MVITIRIMEVPHVDMKVLGNLPASNSPAWCVNWLDVRKVARFALIVIGGYLVTTLTPQLPVIDTWLRAHLIFAGINLYNPGTAGTILFALHQLVSGFQSDAGKQPVA